MGKSPRIQFALRFPKDGLFLLGTESLTGYCFRVQEEWCKFTNSQKECVYKTLIAKRKKGLETQNCSNIQPHV